MARVTVEDSLKVVTERGGGCFHMILLASFRARQLQHGALPKIDPNEDKPTVLALREIAAGYTDFSEEVIPKRDVYGQIIEEKTEETEDDTVLRGQEE